MTNIKRIIREDLKTVVRNLFALIIAIGVCILPALYAWFNIYSNWDPYGNTGNLDLVAVSLDKGYTNDEGEYTNVGSEVIEDMKNSDSIRWHFASGAEEVREGVEAGKYYAGVVINEDFSYNMYKVFTEDVDKPQIIFYENQKKNPVATKISDTVVEKIQAKINAKFVKVMTTEVFKDMNDLGDDIDKEGGIDGLVEKMERVNAEIESYQRTINAVIQGNAVLKAAINMADNDALIIADKATDSANLLSETHDSLKTSQDTLNEYNNEVNLVVATMLSSLDDISKRLDEALVLNDMKLINTEVKTTRGDIRIIRTDIDALRNALSDMVDAGTLSPEEILEVEAAIATIDVIDTSVDRIESLIDNTIESSIGDGVIKRLDTEEQSVHKRVDECKRQISDTQITINSQLIPQLNDTIDNLRIVISDATTLMRQMSSTISGMGNVFSALEHAVNAGNISLGKTSDAIGEINKRFDKIIDKVKKASNNDKVQILLDTIKGDPDVYGEFFSEPVKIESYNIYPVENYGSAVAPFYTILAIWVGAIILAAIIKPVPKRDKYPGMSEIEIFFGRYGLFFIMGQLQTLIIVVGDIALLGVQCLHPFWFYIASAFSSMTFTLLIYSLVVAFSDVGKAIAVVILVIQIAGSSGTYPIELLPQFFQRVYLFFPFPYAINALRECVAGMYEVDYLVYLLELSLFIIVALIIGVWIRRPFDSLKRYMIKRMEDTKVM